MATATQELIRSAVERFTAELPALAKLKLVFKLELVGRGDVQMFRVELPGPKISKSLGEDPRITITIPRANFNDLAESGTVRSYHAAYDTGHIRVEGDEQVKRLLAQVIAKHEERAKLKKAH